MMKKDIYKRSRRKNPLMLRGFIKMISQKKLFLLLQLILLLLHVCGFILTTYCKFVDAYIKYNVDTIIIIIDVYLHLFLCLSNTVVLVIFYRRTELLHHIVKFGGQDKDHSTSKAYKMGMRTLLVLSIGPFFGASIYCTAYFGWDPYKNLVAEDFEANVFNILLIIVARFSVEIKNAFSKINSGLLHVLPTSRAARRKTFTRWENITLLHRLTHLTKQHNQLCDFLDDFNQAFKAGFVFMVVCLCVAILWNIAIILKVGLLDFEQDMKIYLTCIRILSIAISMGQAALVALVGEGIEEEGQNTTVLCDSLLNKITVYEKSEILDLIENQINLLLDQSKSRNISMHAGGFFRINWGILGSIASTVATYSIVIIQFLLKY